MPQICLVILIGLPGAGKTTFCTVLAQKLQLNDSFQCHTVSYDDIMSENNQQQYREARNQAYRTAEGIVESIVIAQNASLVKHIIFIDDNMYYKSMRYQYYKLAKRHKLSYLQIHLDVTLITALARNGSRDCKTRIPESVVADMANKIEVPDEQWELNLLTINSNTEFDETTYTKFIEVLHKSLDAPIQGSVQEKTETHPASKLQTVDLLLRRIVHDILKEDNSQAAVLVKRRKEVYKDIKEGRIGMDETWSEVELTTFLENLFSTL